MRHRVKKIRLGTGSDGTRMQVRQLLKNFLTRGTIVTTDKKIGVLKNEVQHVVDVAKRNTEASKNILLRRLGDPKLASLVIKHVAPVFKTRTGGYVRNTLLPQRMSDSARMGRLQWVEPVVFPALEKRVKEVKEEKKAEDVAKPQKKATAPKAKAAKVAKTKK